LIESVPQYRNTIANTVDRAKKARYTDFAPRTVLDFFMPTEQQRLVHAEQAHEAHSEATQPMMMLFRFS
jgi:hypothetical protein